MRGASCYATLSGMASAAEAIAALKAGSLEALPLQEYFCISVSLEGVFIKGLDCKK